jgi:hypothetical protein
MKNVILLNSYANTSQRRDVLVKCINQLKKLNIDIILTSNYQDDEYVQSLVEYYLYDCDNFLLPKDKSPLKWFADSYETIHVFHPGNSYIVYKHICCSINFAKKLGYENYLYLEFDVDFSDEDLNKINFIFDDYLRTKQMWLCNFYFYEKIAYESRLFAGYTDTLEYILPLLLSENNQSVHFTNVPVHEFFNTSKFDICHITSNIYISYNTETINEPLLFIITNYGEYKIIINDKLEYINDYVDNQIIKYKFNISNNDSNIKVLFNNNKIFEKDVSLKNVESFKNECIRYKL